MFGRDDREDESLYRELYWLNFTYASPEDSYVYTKTGFLCQGAKQVRMSVDSTTDDGGVFLVLNAHATMLAQGEIVSRDLKMAFDVFLREVEENWGELLNKEPTSHMGSAYCAFWRKVDEQSLG